jgi:hypothetical protein
MDTTHILYIYATDEKILENDKIDILKLFLESNDGYVSTDLDLLQPYIQQMLIIACYQNMINLVKYILEKYEIIDVSYDNNNALKQNGINVQIFTLLVNHPSFDADIEVIKFIKNYNQLYPILKLAMENAKVSDEEKEKRKKIFIEIEAEPVEIEDEEEKEEKDLNNNL